MWQQFLEDRISSAIGASVSFEKLSVSPFRGVVDCSRLVAKLDDTAGPFLTIDRVQLKVKMAELLAKRLVIETVLLERPVVTIERAPDGTFNLPIPKTEPTAEPTSGDGASASSGWAAGIRQVILTDGSARYRDQSVGFDGYTVEAGPISLQLDQPVGQPATMTANIAAVRRVDRPADLGSLRVIGEGSGLDHLTNLRQLTGKVTAEIKNLLRAELEATASVIHTTLQAQLAAPGLLGMLPDTIKQQIPPFLLAGRSDLKLETTWDR